MNSQREAFEKEFPLSEDTRWSDERGIYVVKDYDGKYPDPGQNMLYVAWQKGSEWQAATEQGVGEAAGYVSSDNTIAVVDGNLNLPAGTVLYTHSPKPTWEGVPDTYSNEFNDAAWVFVESLPEPKDRAWAVSASIKPALRAFVDALLATQQPPEQE